MDFELLLIDDGSKDASGAICDEYTTKDNRVRVWHQENQGVSVARNVGLEHAQGEWIYFPDSDDIIMENAFDSMVSMVTEGVDYVICGYEVYDENDNCTYAITERKQREITRDEALMEMFAPTDYRHQGYLWNKLFRSSIIRENNLRFVKGIKFNEDRLYDVEYLCCIAGNVAYSTTPIYKYVERSNSAMASLTQRFNPYFLTDLDAFVKMGKLLRASKFEEVLLEAHEREMLFSVGRMYSICRQFGQLNMKWRYDIESRFYKGVGLRLYIKRWTDKFERKIKRICKNS
jgi:glycosyltransferase involved in cell wall biosynthesis